MSAGEPMYSRWALLWWMRRVNAWAQRFTRWGRILSTHTARLSDNAVRDYHLARGHVWCAGRREWLRCDEL